MGDSDHVTSILASDWSMMSAVMDVGPIISLYLPNQPELTSTLPCIYVHQLLSITAAFLSLSLVTHQQLSATDIILFATALKECLLVNEGDVTASATGPRLPRW